MYRHCLHYRISAKCNAHRRTVAPTADGPGWLDGGDGGPATRVACVLLWLSAVCVVPGLAQHVAVPAASQLKTSYSYFDIATSLQGCSDEIALTFMGSVTSHSFVISTFQGNL